ncbi:MAG TPA: putative Ig domain-containing protein [Gemmatimonadaceae bacterium]|nr:putative Ig domain-containing protein [Gemmatimonadaceae bacterium]
MTRPVVSRLAPLAFVALAVAGAYACSDSTGPNDNTDKHTVSLTVHPVYPTDAAKQVVSFDKVHVVVSRTNGTVALDTTITAGSGGRGASNSVSNGADVTSTAVRASVVGTGQGDITLIVPVSKNAPASGEEFSIVLHFLSNNSEVFTGGPIHVIGVAGSSAAVDVSTEYSGPGATATHVTVTPSNTSAAAGTQLNFTAKAFDANNTELTGTPVAWSSLDATLAQVADPAVGRATFGPARGNAHIRATLPNGVFADATIAVTPVASAISRESGNAQTATIGSALPQPLVVKTTASDGGTAGGVVVTFAITSGGGVLSSATATTGTDGLGSVTYTCGTSAAAITITATAAGLTGSPVTFTESCSAANASSVAFTTQPTNTIVGNPVSPAVVVEARDQFGNRVTGFTDVVTLTLDNPPAGVVLQGTTSVNAVAGVATFSNITVSAVANGLRLSASAAGIGGTVLSSTFNATPRPAVALAVVTSLSNVAATEILPPIVVQARDVTGAVVSNYTGLVTIALDAPPAGVTLQGTVTASAVNGIATFTGLSVSGQVTAARLVATGAGITGQFFSNTFVVGPANPLTANPLSATFTVQRTAASPAPLVVNLTSTAAQITGLSVGTITYGAGASGWLGAVLGAGTTPTTLTLTATTSTLAAGTFTATVPLLQASGPTLNYQVTLTVTPLPVTQFVLTTQPAGATSGLAFTTQPVGQLRDATGTLVTTANNSVTVSVNSGTGTLSGTLTRTPVNGVVTFSGLTITGTGAHTLAFNSAGITGAVSNSFTVGAALSTTQAVAATTGTSGTLIPTFTPVTASGGTAPYTFALSGGVLPTGMSFSTTTGAVSGTPTSVLATTTFTVTVTDNVGTQSSKTFQLTVNGPLTTTQAIASRAGTVNTAMAAFTPVTASGGTAPLVFALSGGSLPTGMAFSTTNGQITGTPTTTLATTTFTVTVTDNVGTTSSKTFDLTVNPALTTTQAVAATSGTVGTAIPTFTPVTASGGTTPYAFALSGGTLPTGMSFSTTTGAVSGTPGSALAATTFTVTVTDNAGATSSKTFQLTVNGPLTTTQAVASTTGTQGTPLSFTPVTAAGGTAPLTFALSGGSLPTGVGFNTTNGLVSGTPGAPLAQTTFTVTVTDNVGATSAKTFQLTVNGPLTTTQAVAAKVGTQNTAIPAFTPVTASGGSLPYTFALTGGSLPTGLSFSTTTGQISGTPTTTLATTTFTVTVTDAATTTSSKTFDLTVNTALTTTQAVAATTGTVNTAIPSFTPVTASGGTAPITFALTGGTLPTGMSFSTTTGQITGTPTTTLATTTFTVTATDAANATSSKTFQLTVNGALITTQAVATKSGTVNTAIPAFTPVTASGGTTPYGFALSGGSLPTGMAFSTTTGQITGTPTTTLATTTFTVTVTDAASATSSKTFQLTVNGALTTTQAVATTSGTINTVLPTFTPVTASGGTTPYTFALSGGSLPSGLSFNTTTGAVSGTPTATLAQTTFTVTVTDNAGATSAKTFQLTVNGALTTTQAVPTTTGTQGVALSFTPVTASGGTTPYTFALTGGSLPTGVSFNTTNGLVSGTPGAALAQTTFTVTVTDAASATSAKTFQLTVNGPLSTTQAVAAKVGTVNTAIPTFTPVTAAGGSTPYTFALSGGALPTGMSFNTSTGAVSGTPTTTLATTTFTVTVTDNASATSAKTFDLTVNSALTTTQAVASTVGTVNTAIPSFTPVTASGGTAPYSFALSGGTLPTGMSFSTTTGQVTGTPSTTLSITTFTVTVTDAANATSSKTFNLTVNGALTTTQAVASKVGNTGTLIPTFTPVTASGGTTPYTFALSGGSLPTGMSFNTTNGQVSGTPSTTLAQTTFTVTVTDAASATSAKTFDLTVNGALSTTQAVAAKSGTINTAIPSFTPVTASGGTTPYTFALSGGSLPAGMSFSTTTGAVSGTPTATLGTTTFTVTVTDNIGATSAKTFDLTVNSALLTNQAVASTSGTVNTVIPTFTPVTASGGTTPYTFALSGGSLPTGMSFNTSTGAVSGTPTTTLAQTTFTVTVTDNAGANSAKTFQLTVNGPLSAVQAIASTTLQATPNSQPAITPFTPVTASGGTAPYTFAITSGSLPTGLSFNTSTGQITGRPQSLLTSPTTFTVQVTDNTAATASNTFDLTVNGIALNVTASATQSVQTGQDITIPLLIDMSHRGTDDIGSITVSLTWDQTRFDFKSASAGTGIGAAATIGPATVNPGGPVNCSVFSASGTTSDFTVCNVVLTAKTTTGVSGINASVSASANAVGNPVFVTPRNVSVTITP